MSVAAMCTQAATSDGDVEQGIDPVRQRLTVIGFDHLAARTAAVARR
jgi:hypothetical protein